MKKYNDYIPKDKGEDSIDEVTVQALMWILEQEKVAE